MPFKSCEFVVLAFFFVGCAREVTTRTFPDKEIIPLTPQYSIDLPGDKSPIRLLYMGCGHLIFEYEGELIVTDPYFSIQPFSPGGKIKSSREDFRQYQSTLAANGMDLRNAKSVWIAHAHYDHLMDLPLLLKEKALPLQIVIYGNAFGKDILSRVVPPEQYETITSEDAYDPMNPSRPGKWRKAAASIRVMPIRSDHAPHMKVGPVSIHLMNGKLNPDYFADTFSDADLPTKKNEWTEGCVYSFLIDFMDRDSIVYRLFVQTSASHFPLGNPPPELLKEHPVDVAVLCLASSNTVKPYPVEILQLLQPRATVFIHWEDFFERAQFGRYRLVRLTNFKKISKRMKKSGIPLSKDKHVMPQPGTLITFK